MKKVVRNLVIGTILLSGTQVISMPVGSLSIFQIMIIITVLMAIADILIRKKIYRGQYLLFSVIYAFSSIMAWIISSNPSWANSYLLLGIVFAAMVFIIPNYFTKDDIGLLEKTLIRSQYIVFPFAVYSFYMFYFAGGIPEYISLPGGFFIELDADTLLRGQASSQIRLTLPYATPPILSVVMAICVIILLTNPMLYEKKIRNILIVLFSAVLLLAGSRTGLVGLVLMLLVLGGEKIKKTFTVSKKLILLFVGMLPIIVGGLFCAGQTLYVQKLLKRFFSVDLLSDRHLLIPLDGILIWVESFKNFIIGIGFGSSINIQGKHTYLPAYFLNSYVTLLAERGIFGVVLVVLLIYTCYTVRKKYKKSNVEIYSLGCALLTGLFCCIFYEALNCYFLIFVIAIAFLVECRNYNI